MSDSKKQSFFDRLALFTIINGAGYLGLKYMAQPSYKLELTPDKAEKPTAVTLTYSERYHPDLIGTQHKSLRCLHTRGYAISEAMGPYGNRWNPPISSDSDTISKRPIVGSQDAPIPLLRITRIKHEEEFDIDDFLKSCKECGTHTDMQLKTIPGPYSTKSTKYVDRHDWHMCYNGRVDPF